ncbi:EAL domain-containing response regulator [Vibrio hannami]|uniref:EAL domain-containing response regulator n=1 Tax=Vibrio hannami TaxID=2717094 RepID=UPI00240EE553|nr:EAL domain-containing response regulator [Vibrio hannami]MDG3087856.1 EAL domain-containing response regulator [Vibrio hannami]
MDKIKQIMIVEDEPFQRLFVKKIVGSVTKANITVAVDGIDALEQVTQLESIDVIICDISMPNLDGVELLRALADKNLDPVVILVSAAAPEVISSVREMTYSYGMSKAISLSKPLIRSDVASALEQAQRHLSKQHSAWKNNQFTPTKTEIISALENGEIQPFFQPQIDISTRKVVSSEVLARWVHPSKGIIAPNLFLPKIKEYDLNDKLNVAILSRSTEYASIWYKQGYNVGLSVNIAPTELTDINFVDTCLSIISKTGFPPSLLTIEVTENELSPHLGKMLDTLNRLRINGINISLDDFGTGHASLLQMTSIPINELKIDQYFIQQSLTDIKCKAAALCAITLCKQLDIKVVAEGVETVGVEAFLREHKCDLAQGFLYSQALPPRQFISWLGDYSVTGLEKKK